MTFGRAGGFRKGAAAAFASRQRQSKGVARALGARTAKKEFYVQVARGKGSVTIGLLSRKVTRAEQTARVDGGSKIKKFQRAARPGKVVRTIRIGRA